MACREADLKTSHQCDRTDEIQDKSKKRKIANYKVLYGNDKQSEYIS